METSNVDKFRGRKKRAISTLNAEDPQSPISKGQIFHDRRCGNSTRLCDYAVQLLFAGHLVVIEDHVDHGKNNRVNQHLFEMVMERIHVMMIKMPDRGKGLKMVVDKNPFAIDFSAVPQK